MTTEALENGTPSDLLSVHVEDFLGQLRTAGYADRTLRKKRTVVSAFARWMKDHRITLGCLVDSDVVAFSQRRRRRADRIKAERVALRLLLQYLRAKGLINQAPVWVDASTNDLLERRFSEYLRQDRGLAENSLRVYVPCVRHFLAAQVSGHDAVSSISFDPSMVRRYLLTYSGNHSKEQIRLLVAALRAFLHFLFLRGDTSLDLSVSIPTVRTWRQTSVPTFLSPEDVERVLQTTDPKSCRGRRDHAILLLLSRLGLRAGEIVSLELGDLRWRSGEIVVRGKGRVVEHLPLLAEIGEALALYLQQDRGARASQRVFLRMYAPHAGLTGPAAVGHIVRLAFTRAGLRPSSRGAAHLLRHSLATVMIRQGASMAQIAEVLRHRSQNTTAIYAKVAFESLRCIARPWPVAGGVQ